MVRFPFIPREEKFFELFREAAGNMVAAATKLIELLEHYEDIETKLNEIVELEHKGDAIIHNIMRQLHRTFVTPLDREDIALLSQRIDDVVDCIEGAAHAMIDYKITSPTDKAKELAAIIMEAAKQLEEGVSHLSYRRAQLSGVLEHCVEINRLENEADAVVRSALVELFTDSDHYGETSVSDIMKWREIYDQLEEATDRCEDAADVLEGVVLKHA